MISHKLALFGLIFAFAFSLLAYSGDGEKGDLGAPGLGPNSSIENAHQKDEHGDVVPNVDGELDSEAVKSIESDLASAVLPRDIGSVDGAKQFAREFLKQYRKQFPDPKDTHNDEIVAIHLGNKIPVELEAAMAILDHEGLRVRAILVDQEKFKTILKDANNENTKAVEYVRHKRGDASAGQIDETQKSLLAKFGQMTGNFFGFHNGFTWLWRMKLRRSPAEKILEMKGTSVNVVVGGIALAATLYYKSKHGQDVQMLRGILIPSIYVWALGYWGRIINEFQSQGRTAYEYEPGKFRIVRGEAWLYLSTAIRNFVLTNPISILSSLGFYYMFDPSSWIVFGGKQWHPFHAEHMRKSIENSVFNLLARVQIDKWFINKQAATLKDGTVQVRDGQWHPRTYIIATSAWAVFYGLVKNLHLFSEDIPIDESAHFWQDAHFWIERFPLILLGGVGTGLWLRYHKYTIRRFRSNTYNSIVEFGPKLKRDILRVVEWVRTGKRPPAQAPEACETLFIRVKANTDLNTIVKASDVR